jgi:RNA methyltransferase, TrmH family
MITSSHNPKLQQVRALLARRDEREEQAAFVAEGVRLVEEAQAGGVTPEFVLYSKALSERGRGLVEVFSQKGVDVEEITPSLMESIAGTETPQGILAVLPMLEIKIPAVCDFVLILDNIRDPGNLGTQLRSAAAAGVQVVFLTPGSVDVYSPKVVRAAMGAHFKLPVLTQTWDEISKVIRPQGKPGLNVFLAEAEGGVPYWQADMTQPVALVVGSEAEGASDRARALATSRLFIPMPGCFESLNAAIAGSILIFEAVRQRSQ